MDHRLKTRKDRRGVDLIFDPLPFGRLSPAEPKRNQQFPSATPTFTAGHMML
jgi:hypothetical protein